MLVVSEVSCLSCDVATTHHGVQGGLGLAQFPPAPLFETLGMSGNKLLPPYPESQERNGVTCILLGPYITLARPSQAGHLGRDKSCVCPTCIWPTAH